MISASGKEPGDTRLETALRTYWGHVDFRPLQREIIETVMAGKDVLALLPTGGGKSLCYQLPAVVQDGCALVISPLVALMEDQVSQLRGRGIPAAALHAGVKGRELAGLIAEIKNESFKLLYCSPERLQSRLFQELLPHMRISLIAVDEAHCVSQWGHDFRREYLEISFLKKRFPRLPMLALTASATPTVTDDIRRHLLIPSAQIFRQSFARPNIYYRCRYSENKPTDLQNAVAAAGGSAIVYCRSRRHTESIAQLLRSGGICAASYHAGMKQEDRSKAQQAWMSGASPVMVATTAFGMGIDKGDVRLVVHYDLPGDLESWYQESGRGGRDGNPATALTLFNRADTKGLEGSGKIQYPPVAFLREVYQAVVEYLQIPIGAAPDRYFPFEITDFCGKFSLMPRKVAPAIRLLSQEGFWTLTETVFHPPTVQFTCSREDIDTLARRYLKLHLLATGLLRLYTGIFSFPAAVHLHAISKKLRWRQEEVAQGLQQLATMGLIEWEPVVEGPQLYFNSLRVDSHDLIIDTERLAILRQRHEARTEAALRFFQNENTCRNASILRYFGEEPSAACGHCDVCSRKSSNIPSPTELNTYVLESLNAQAGPIKMSALTSPQPEIARPALTATLRLMVESGIIEWHPDNSFSLPPKKARKS